MSLAKNKKADFFLMCALSVYPYGVPLAFCSVLQLKLFQINNLNHTFFLIYLIFSISTFLAVLFFKSLTFIPEKRYLLFCIFTACLVLIHPDLPPLWVQITSCACAVTSAMAVISSSILIVDMVSGYQANTKIFGYIVGLGAIFAFCIILISIHSLELAFDFGAISILISAIIVLSRFHRNQELYKKDSYFESRPTSLAIVLIYFTFFYAAGITISSSEFLFLTFKESNPSTCVWVIILPFMVLSGIIMTAIKQDTKYLTKILAVSCFFYCVSASLLGFESNLLLYIMLIFFGLSWGVSLTMFLRLFGIVKRKGLCIGFVVWLSAYILGYATSDYFLGKEFSLSIMALISSFVLALSGLISAWYNPNLNEIG